MQIDKKMKSVTVGAMKPLHTVLLHGEIQITLTLTFPREESIEIK